MDHVKIPVNKKKIHLILKQQLKITNNNNNNNNNYSSSNNTGNNSSNSCHQCLLDEQVDMHKSRTSSVKIS